MAGVRDRFAVTLTCSGSQDTVSQIHMASLPVAPEAGGDFPDPLEFVVGVSLRDRVSGTVSVYLPDGRQFSREFRAPLILE